jgi:catechol 2,3-dioxygenase
MTDTGDEFRVGGIDHVELFVPDRRAAAEWYARVLGFEVLRAYAFWADDPRGPLLISPDGGRTKLALFEGSPAGRARDEVGIRRIAFGVGGAGFLAFVNRLEVVELHDARGGRVTAKCVVDHDAAFSIYFVDPWGTSLELTTYDVDMVRHARRG